MRKCLFAACAVALAVIMSGCLTSPPTQAIADAASPNIVGSESTYTGIGDPGAHAWTDDQARTLLWLRRNLPELWSDIPFPLITLFSYNIHNDLKPFGEPVHWKYYFADADDSLLQVRMLTLEARDRNDTRREDVAAKQAAEMAAAEQAVTEDISTLSDQEVAQKLETVFP